MIAPIIGLLLWVVSRGKVMDNIIMMKSCHIFNSSNLQFGFKANHSTTQCSFVVEEVIEYYNKHDSSVFMVTLDATKAFDRVEYCKLFSLLLDPGLCPLYARFILCMYTHQKLRVNWNGIYSELFDVSNGVKQGGILSPILFCIYVDVLLERFKNSKISCHVGNTFIGGIGYADDVCLLAPTCEDNVNHL